jgi:hypothetical protein
MPPNRHNCQASFSERGVSLSSGLARPRSPRIYEDFDLRRLAALLAIALSDGPIAGHIAIC